MDVTIWKRSMLCVQIDASMLVRQFLGISVACNVEFFVLLNVGPFKLNSKVL